ncbi:MAG: site-specific integrase [Candidatus Eremiobacterota bacterium]
MRKNQSIKTFDVMATDLLSYLTLKGYAKGTISRYHNCIKGIKTYLEQQGITIFNAKICSHFVEHLIGNRSYQYLTRFEKDKIRCANAVLEYGLTGSISFRTLRKNTSLYGKIGLTISEYFSYKKSKNISIRTLENNQLYLQRFQDFLENHGITDVKNISKSDILSFIKSLSFYSKGTIHCTLCALRGFLRYMQDNRILESDWSYLVPQDNYRKEAKLPTTYEKYEIEKIIKAVDRGNPKGKRDYAIILLAARLGLRSSDICRMKFENLVWEQNLIVFTQQKTSKRIELPLLPEVGNSIIDYLKYARPNSESPYIFLHVNPCYERLQEPTIHSIVWQYMRQSGIRNINQKKHGPHALRHSLAGFLLEKKTPLPVISEVLGHTNTESTKTYLRIDMEGLRQCALKVPALYTPFYERGRKCWNG